MESNQRWQSFEWQHIKCWCSQNHVRTHSLTNTYRKYIFNLTCDNKHIHFTASILMFERMYMRSVPYTYWINADTWDARRWVSPEHAHSCLYVREFLFYACVINDSISQVELSWVESSRVEQKGENYAQEITEKRFQIHATDTAQQSSQYRKDSWTWNWALCWVLSMIERN